MATGNGMVDTVHSNSNSAKIKVYRNPNSITQLLIKDSVAAQFPISLIKIKLILTNNSNNLVYLKVNGDNKDNKDKIN